MWVVQESKYIGSNIGIRNFRLADIVDIDQKTVLTSVPAGLFILMKMCEGVVDIPHGFFYRSLLE
jgi:hypothetical protein